MALTQMYLIKKHKWITVMDMKLPSLLCPFIFFFIFPSTSANEMGAKGVIVTDAPGLKCRKIVFVSMDTFSRNWNDGIAEVLSEVDKLGLKSLALPALGAGEI